MQQASPGESFRALRPSEKERLFLDILKTPDFEVPDGWGARFHAWLEEEAAEGRSLGEIGLRIDLPRTAMDAPIDPWDLLERHVSWLLERGYARVVRIEVVA
jgi:hypothetical protein